MLMNRTGFLAIVLLLIVCKGGCFQSKICRKPKESKTMCEKIYVWDKERQYFVSLADEVLKSFTKEEYEETKQKEMKLLICHMMPYVSYNASSRRIGGYLGEIWNILAEILKFDYKVMLARYEEGLEILSRGEADVMLAAVVYKEGLTNVYYSHPYLYNWYQLYLKSPKGKPSSNLYFTIFYSKLSFFTFLMFCLIAASVWMTSWYLSSVYKIERRLSISACLLGVVSGYINQGFDLKLRSYSGRLQVFLAMIFGLMLYYAMNATLVAKIAVFEAPYPFTSLPDIAKRKTLSLCLRTSSFVYNNFTENKRVLPEWQGILNNERCLDILDSTNIPKIICNENVIVLENKVVMSSLSKMVKYACTIDAFGEIYFKSGNSFLMSKALREKRVIDKYVTLMRSTGVLQRLEEVWIDNDKTSSAKASTPQVTIEHTRNVFIFYGIAMLVTLIILALEILHDKCVDANIKVVDYCN